MQTRYFVKSALVAPNPPMLKGTPKAMYAEFAKDPGGGTTCVSGLFTKSDIEDTAKHYGFKPKFIDVLDAPALDTLRNKTRFHKTTTQEWEFDWDERVWRKREYTPNRGYVMYSFDSVKRGCVMRPVDSGKNTLPKEGSITKLRAKTKREEVWFTKYSVVPGVRYFPKDALENAPELATPEAAAYTEHNARVDGFDIGFVDGPGSALVPNVHLSYDGYIQTFGDFIVGGQPGSRAGNHANRPNSAGEFIVGVLNACGVDKISKCKDSIVRIRLEERNGNDVIVAIGHALDKDKWFNPGEVFGKWPLHLKQTT